LLHALVTPADVQDRDGGLMLLATLFGQFPFLKKLFADSAYAGPVFHDRLADIMPNLVTEIVRRSDQAKGFVVLPKRWIVERTIGWLGSKVYNVPVSRRLVCGHPHDADAPRAKPQRPKPFRGATPPLLVRRPPPRR
jgi:transposase